MNYEWGSGEDFSVKQVNSKLKTYILITNNLKLTYRLT
jgi:hypothetical protein